MINFYHFYLDFISSDISGARQKYMVTRVDSSKGVFTNPILPRKLAALPKNPHK